MDDKQGALIAAAFYGRTKIIAMLVNSGVDVNAYITKGFHTHAPALHQAVYSGSLDAVKLLVEAGASLAAIDRVYNGTPLGWAIYMQTEDDSDEMKMKHAEIETYLYHKLRRDNDK